MIHILADVLRSSILITGLVIIMMLLIEYVNVESGGHFFSRLNSNRFTRVVFGAFMGLIPGCMGGFATVSLYSHGMLSFGALIAMMIASSGDEAFVMLAMIPRQALVLFAVLFVIAVAVGLLVDLRPSGEYAAVCRRSYDIHESDIHENKHGSRSIRNLFKPEWKRWTIILAVLLFIVALVSGILEHDEMEQEGSGVNILSERWLNLLFAALSLFVLWFTATSESHFVCEHLWDHVVKGHAPSIFCWTFGALLVIGLGMHYIDLSAWMKDNVALIIFLAVLIGIIPDSGPHLIFVTMFASGLVPFSVLLASSISQDGHSSLPLLAETKKGFVKAKLINCAVAAVAGYALYFFGL